MGCVAALRAVTCAGRPAGLLPASPQTPDGRAGASSLLGSMRDWHGETTLVLGWALD